MFPLHTQSGDQSCFASKVQDSTWLWHFHYGHLNFNGLKTLQQKEMVTGLPPIQSFPRVCEECAIGKQHRDSFPKGDTLEPLKHFI